MKARTHKVVDGTQVGWGPRAPWWLSPWLPCLDGCCCTLGRAGGASGKLAGGAPSTHVLQELWLSGMQRMQYKLRALTMLGVGAGHGSGRKIAPTWIGKVGGGAGRELWPWLSLWFWSVTSQGAFHFLLCMYAFIYLCNLLE